MYVVVIDGWQEATPQLAQTLGGVLGVSAYEARQRLIGGGPVVIATCAEEQTARGLGSKLLKAGFAGFAIEADQERIVRSHFAVRRFELTEEALSIESTEGDLETIPYGDIDLLLLGTGIAMQMETQTVAERKFSMGKTMLAGGVPMGKTVKKQEDVRTEEREEVLYLRAGKRPLCVFLRNSMAYDGLGAQKKSSRDLNFAYLLSELQRRSPSAVYDGRLLKRAGQVRLLGPSLDPEKYLPLAMEVLARGLVRRRG